MTSGQSWLLVAELAVLDVVLVVVVALTFLRTVRNGKANHD